MRKILAIVLLLVLGVPSALPLFAAGRDDAGVPACCRRAGKHHCLMQAGEAGRASEATREMRAAGEACPYRCALLTRAHVETGFAVAASLRWYAGVLAHPAVQAQTESRWRVARERARGKRGPPNKGKAVTS